MDEGQDQDQENEYVDEPEAIRRRILKELDQHKAVAEAYRKICKASHFEDAAAAEINVAIKHLKLKWGKVQGALKRKEL